jgi:NitT/TauT family transport system ATP-binding protein
MIEIRNLYVEYPNLPVIEDISFSIKEGELVSIIGASGCGKTTLLKTIGGLLINGKNATITGDVLVNGLAPTEAKQKRLFGYSSQNPVLLPWRNVQENIRLPLEVFGIDDFAKVKDIINSLGLAGFEKSLPNELSGGMKQRSSLARAIIHNPSILLMDEPFGSLDEITRDSINVFYRDLHNRRKQTAIFVTHSLREALFLSDKIIILTTRPSKIKYIFTVDLPRERTSDIFYEVEYLQQIKELQNEFLK